MCHILINQQKAPSNLICIGHLHDDSQLPECFASFLALISELNVDNWNDNCEAKIEGKSPRPSRGLQVDFSLTRNVSYAVR